MLTLTAINVRIGDHRVTRRDGSCAASVGRSLARPGGRGNLRVSPPCRQTAERQEGAPQPPLTNVLTAPPSTLTVMNASPSGYSCRVNPSPPGLSPRQRVSRSRRTAVAHSPCTAPARPALNDEALSVRHVWSGPGCLLLARVGAGPPDHTTLDRAATRPIDVDGQARGPEPRGPNPSTRPVDQARGPSPWTLRHEALFVRMEVRDRHLPAVVAVG